MSDVWYLPDGVTAESRMEAHRPSGGAGDEEDAPTFFSLQQTTHFIGKTFEDFEVSGDDFSFVDRLLADLGYAHHDVITIDAKAWGEEKFESMAKMHFEEHLHEDDEVRLILEGGGYFDIRSADDRWLRVQTNAGDCIVIPAGMYHRFTTKPDRYTKALRLFKENPKWEAVPRGPAAEATAARRNYLELIKRPEVRTEYARLLLRRSLAETLPEKNASPTSAFRQHASETRRLSGVPCRRRSTTFAADAAEGPRSELPSMNLGAEGA